MKTAIALGLGYVLGARAGRERYDAIRRVSDLALTVARRKFEELADEGQLEAPPGRRPVDAGEPLAADAGAGAPTPDRV